MTLSQQKRHLWPLLYLFDKTQFIVTCLTACFQLYTLSSGVTYFIVGALACLFSVKVVKKLVRQPRPVGTSKKLSYGMPSTHSAAITYYALYISASCLYLPLHKSLECDSSGSSAYFRTLVPLLVILWASMVVLSRVWLGHHTWQQVAVGSAYGAGFAIFWFTLWFRGGVDLLGNQTEDRLIKLLGLA